MSSVPTRPSRPTDPGGAAPPGPRGSGWGHHHLASLGQGTGDCGSVRRTQSPGLHHQPQQHLPVLTWAVGTTPRDPTRVTRPTDSPAPLRPPRRRLAAKLGPVGTPTIAVLRREVNCFNFASPRGHKRGDGMAMFTRFPARYTSPGVPTPRTPTSDLHHEVN